MVNIQEVVIIIIIVNTVLTGFTALEPGGEVLRVLNSMELCGGVFPRPSLGASHFREQLSCLLCAICWK